MRTQATKTLSADTCASSARSDPDIFGKARRATAGYSKGVHTGFGSVILGSEWLEGIKLA